MSDKPRAGTLNERAAKTPFATVQTILFLRGVHDTIIDAFAYAYRTEPDEALLQAMTLAAASDTLIEIVNRNPDLPID